MKTVYFKSILALTCLAVFTGQVFAQSGGTTAVPFLTLGAGARSLAMGEAATATANDATALYWNPGTLMNLKGQSATFMHASTVEDSFFDYAAYGRRKDDSAWGASLQYFSAGSVDQTDISGNVTGSITPNDVAVTGGYAHTFSGYGVGVSAKYIQSKLLDTATTGAMDAGVVSPFFMGDRLRAAVSMANLGGSIKYDQESSSLPLTFRGGVEVRPWKGWIGALDLVAPKDEDAYVALGGEYQMAVGSDISVAIRAGYNSRSTNGGGTQGVSAGLGFGWKKLIVDYAFITQGDLDAQQVLSVGYNF